MFIVILNYYHLSGDLNSKIIGTYGTLTTRKIEDDVKQFINENLFDDDNVFSDYEFQLVGHYLPIKKLANVEDTTDLTSSLWDLCKKEDEVEDKESDRVYWEIDIDERKFKFNFLSYVSKDDYELIKKLKRDTCIDFGDYNVCNLSEIVFYEKSDKEIRNRYKYSKNDFDLMEYLYDQSFL